MLMMALSAGGVPPFTDGVRRSDSCNRHGYFELEDVKTIASDNTFLSQANGRAVKIVSPLLCHLDAKYEHKVIFMERDILSIVASQGRMRAELEPAHKVYSSEEAQAHVCVWQKHISDVQAWLSSQQNISTIYLDYLSVLEKPVENMERVAEFIGRNLDIEAMVDTIDPSLCHQLQA
jgi:hypothetical protein